MKRILVVAYHFPPEEGSCSEKNIRIVQLLLDYNFKVLVLTKPGSQFLWKHPNLKIIRTKQSGVFHKSYKPIKNNENENISTKKPNKIRKLISNSIIPDGAIDWTWEGKKFFKANRNIFQDIDLILSISSPYSAHILSGYISRKLNVPFIMSYGDPWIYEPKRKRSILRYKIEYGLEKYLVSKSSGLLVITNYNKEKYIKLYNVPENKIRTFLIGFDNSVIHNIPIEKNPIFRIIYGGSLDPVHRNPEPFIKAMSKIRDINVSLYNNDNKDLFKFVQHYAVTQSVHIYPIIASSQFISEMYKNDALLLFGNATPYQIPGKIFTYIATGKTIIYLKNNTCLNDGTEEILREYGNSIILNNDEESIIKGMKAYLTTERTQSIPANKEIFEFHHTMLPIVEMINDILYNR